MIWGLIKLCVFVTLAVLSGLFFATVPIGGKTLATRAQSLWAEPVVKQQVAQVETRVRRGVAAATADSPTPAEPPHATKVDLHAVAKVVSDAPPGDDFKPSERAAVSQLIQKRARAAHPASR